MKGLLVILLAIGTAVLGFTSMTPASSQTPTLTPVAVLPGQGVSFAQVDFTWPGATTLNSSTGQVNVDIATLQTLTGLSSGFINVSTGLGWVVQNLPVLSGFSYPSVSTKFQLGTSSSIDITSLDAFVSFSSTPLTSAPTGPPATFPVGDTRFNGQGKESRVTGGPPIPPPPAIAGFAGAAVGRDCPQENHPNVQTANNQCGPAAVANSLQWLEDTYPGIVVPHDNVLGLRGVPANSLVGQLDLWMGRGARSRVDGDPVTDLGFVEGKLMYLDGLGQKLSVKHQDDNFGGQNVNAAGQTSRGLGSPTAAFIIDEICKGEDVELGYSWATGGHWVEVVGAGTTSGGVDYVLYKSDHLQTDQDPTDTLGTDTTDFSEIRDVDGDTLPNLVNEANQPEVDIVVSQSLVEVDYFPNSRARVEISSPFGTETVALAGPTTVEVSLGHLADMDHNGREEIQTEIVQMELTGNSALLGPVTVRLRDPAKHPFQRSLGEIEETHNFQTGRLDLLGDNPPLCVEHPSPPPNCVGTTADSFFDVFFEVEAAGMVLHNDIPKHMEATITHKPPAGGETYENPDPIPLYNESEVQVATVTSTFHTPNPAPVGGIAEFPPLAGTSPEAAGAPAEGSGWSAGNYAALAGGLAAGVMAITVGAWYARRRWVR